MMNKDDSEWNDEESDEESEEEEEKLIEELDQINPELSFRISQISLQKSKSKEDAFWTD
jgi:hypothetical protein